MMDIETQIAIAEEMAAHPTRLQTSDAYRAIADTLRTTHKMHAALERLTYYLNGINESGVHAPSSDEWADANKQAQEILAEIRGEPAEAGNA